MKWAYQEQGSSLDRRSLFKRAAISSFGLAGLALVGCGDDDDDDSSTPASDSMEPKRGGTLLSTGAGASSYPSGYDPHGIKFGARFTYATHSLLVRNNVDSADARGWELQPEAAAKWEQPDELTYIFHLQDNLKFHNIAPASGRAATAEDVKYSIDRISEDLTGFRRKGDFKDTKVEAVDAKTVKITTAFPLAPFWGRLTTPGTVILPKESVDAAGGYLKTPAPVAGTGPFMHERYDADRIATKVRNPEYYKPGLPYLDGLEEIFMLDKEAQWVAFKAGQIDWVAVEPNNAQEALSRANTNTRLTTRAIPFWIVFNTGKPPFDDARVRYALSIATPRQDIVDTVFPGNFADMAGPGGLNPRWHGAATWTFDELKKRPGYRSGKAREEDIAEAKKLLAAAGFTGLKLTMAIGNSLDTTDSAAILKEAYKEVGLDLTFRVVPYSEFLKLGVDKSFDMIMHLQGFANTDVDDAVATYFAADRKIGTRNYGDWQHAEFNELLAKEQRQTKLEERYATVRKMAEILEKEVPRIPIVNQVSLLASQAAVHDISLVPGNPSLDAQDATWKTA